MTGHEGANEGLWSAETRAFNGPRLRRAIVARGWTTAEFARTARVKVASVYNALSGRRVRDGTAIRIFETLERRNPMMVAVESN